MNNAVVMLVYNQVPAQFQLTQSAVDSVLSQDVPVDLFLIDNGSTEARTWPWLNSLESRNITVQRNKTNQSPVQVSNWWMGELFGRMGYQHILGVPNDAILPPNLLREFLKWPRGIVTGSMSAELPSKPAPDARAVNECTPMSVALVRKWVWQSLMAKDGFFYDPRFTLYCSDCDLALRIAACGIRGVQLDIQYFHFGSGSHRMLEPKDAAVITDEANLDRQRFADKWGFPVTAYEYGACAADINFRG